ncbi:MAG TPA: DUF1015 domain-containing protein [Acidimicrobiia bacterium]|jgi:uncharacterized protein (DUF1015 family)
MSAAPDPKVNRLVPQFLPFRGIRYDAARLGAHGFGAVVAPPYDVIDDDERARLGAEDEHQSVRLILPGGDDTTRYQAAASDFATWRADGVLIRDDAPSFTIYRMRFRDEDGTARHTLGVVGALGLPERGDDAVLPHERTLPKAKSDRLALLRATRANFDPIWGLSLSEGLTKLIEPDGVPDASCTDTEGVEHTAWHVNDPKRCEAIAQAVGASRLVLADGHHRFETALNYRDELRAAGKSEDGAGSIMTFVVELADDELTVRPIHRLITRVGDGIDVRAALASAFDMTDAGPNSAEGVVALQRRMRAEGGLGIVDANGLALARPRADVVEGALRSLPEPVRPVDAAVFEQVIVPALGSPEVVYRHDATDVAAMVEKGATAAVLLRPVTVEQIRAVAFAGERMPQKTTFFHPKPRTGVVFRCLDDS